MFSALGKSRSFHGLAQFYFERLMIRVGIRSTLVFVLVVSAGGVSGCDFFDRGSGPSVGELRSAGILESIRPIEEPDLSRLPGSLRAQVKEYYSGLSSRLGDDGLSAEELSGAYGDVGLILMAAEYEKTALDCLSNAYLLNPNEPKWPYYLGQFYLLRGEHSRAAEFFAEAHELQPGHVPTLVWFGESFLDRGLPIEATPLFQAALDIEPTSAKALSGFGRALLEQGEGARAVQYLKQALVIEPEATRLHYSLALAYRSLGQLEMANAHLKLRGNGEPTLVDPRMEKYYGLIESALAYQNRGFQAFESGDWATAADHFRRGLELEPDNLSLRHTLGTALHQMGEVEAAIAEFEGVVRLSPSHSRASFSLGVIFASTGRYEDAHARFAQAVQHEPDYIQAHLGLADVLQAMRRPDEAISHYRNVVTVDPRQLESWISGANTLIELERYQEADRWLVEARKVHPELPELLALQETVQAIVALRRTLR